MFCGQNRLSHFAQRVSFKSVSVRSLVLALVAATISVADQAVAAAPCSSSKLAEVLEPVSDAKPSVSVQCNLQLKSTDVVTKVMSISGAAASGVIVDCGGGSIGSDSIRPGRSILRISSTKSIDASTGNPTWSRPENVTIRNCTIKGRVSVSGMSAADQTESSYKTGHTLRMQNAAPRGIRLENLKLVAQGIIPLYVFPGVTSLSLRNSTLSGTSNSVSVYLDAETGYNVLKNNTFGGSTAREHIAVDGSAHNSIIGNNFLSYSMGGIYLYRNCGENKIVRHQTPSYNELLNNRFAGPSASYGSAAAGAPAVWVGSRNGNRDYCGDDAGYPFGSSVNNGDLARYNVVAQNQFKNAEPDFAIRFQEQSTVLKDNLKVTDFIARNAMCYMSTALPTAFFSHGSAVNYTMSSTGLPECTGKSYTCGDGEILEKTLACDSIAKPVTVNFGCQAVSNNSGCGGTVTCPKGMRIATTKTACNLEFGLVTAAQFGATDWNTLEVVRSSDGYINSFCSIGSTSITNGFVETLSERGGAQTSFGCREFDSNGGDCNIIGSVICL